MDLDIRSKGGLTIRGVISPLLLDEEGFCATGPLRLPKRSLLTLESGSAA